MICTSIVVLPSQFEQLIQTYKERKKMGQNFHLNLTKYDKHVVSEWKWMKVNESEWKWMKMMTPSSIFRIWSSDWLPIVLKSINRKISTDPMYSPHSMHFRHSGRLLDNVGRRHDLGLPKRVLRTSAAAGKCIRIPICSLDLFRDLEARASPESPKSDLTIRKRSKVAVLTNHQKFREFGWFCRKDYPRKKRKLPHKFHQPKWTTKPNRKRIG